MKKFSLKILNCSLLRVSEGISKLMASRTSLGIAVDVHISNNLMPPSTTTLKTSLHT